jgi:POT family proton-dependent oligopeptide transporter
MFKQHPQGLMVLFFTEMWERFGFYLMLGIFTLYMIAGSGEKFPGLGLSEAGAADIYGTYLALVYLTPFFGGLLADRILGYRKSIFIGGVLMALGYMGLAIPNSMMFFFLSLFLIILGNGLFKPNISVLLGKLYESEEYIHLKDSGFNIFYMGINIGAFMCNFVAAYLRIQFGWGWAFAAAGIGMFIGIFWLMFGQQTSPRIKEVDVISPAKEGDMPLGQIFVKLFLPAIVFAAIGWLIPNNVFGADSTDAFVFFSIPVVWFYINIWRKADKEEKQPIAALLSVMGVVVIFWAVFHQNGSALTYWAKNYTDREVTGTTEVVLETLNLTEEVSTVPRPTNITGPHGEDLGSQIKPSYYFDNHTGEKPSGLTEKPEDIDDAVWAEIAEEEKSSYGFLNLWPTELQASINPFFIIILTPLVVGFFNWMAKRNRAVSTPVKIGYGLLITALSMLVMVVAAVVTDNGAMKASVGWLFGVYGVITVGELCLSPMGLSLVSKLSPKRIAALMMGGWFLSTAIGNKLSGVLSGLWTVFDNKAYFFLTNTLLTMVAVVGIFILVPWLKKVVEGGESK